ncbi:MAG: CHC2 zinc finger domain-containing protein, partial [Lachnospiraceae bacterium]|nr:CHC2 zinc finger domain-containing protein [Lachnospiraceae bacterium]
VFEAVRDTVTARQVAEHYGLQVGRNGMASCPFHHDRHPSMKVDKRFYCFGCGEKGDAIDYVAKIFGIGKADAAIQIASDFSISYDKYCCKSEAKTGRRQLPELTLEQKYQKMEKRCFRVLSDYLHLMKSWEVQYAPQTMEQELHPLFVEALQKITETEYKLDILLYAPLSDRISLVTECGERIVELEGRLEQYHRRTEKSTGTGCEADGTEK